MSHKRFYTILTLTAIGIISFFRFIPFVYAQEADPSENLACKGCHEDQYLRFDTGKWYCQCGKQRACTDCHGGDATTWDVDEAHVGIVANPILESPAVCQDCHPEDYQAHIENFAAVAGIDPNATPAPTPTPFAIAAKANAAPVSPLLQALPAESWRIGAIIVVSGLFLALTFFGMRCWRAECLEKIYHR